MRERRPSTRYSFVDLVYNALVASIEVKMIEPTTYKEAIHSSDSNKWKQVMDEEMELLRINGTWELVPKPKNQQLVECKWLYKLKEGMSISEPFRFKARLVAKRFTQRKGIDYNEIFSPVVKFKTIRLMLAIVVQFNLELEQLDVKTAFLHGDLEEKIYMSQPAGYVDSINPNHVCLLKKSLYGLKQSPRQWYKRFDNFVIDIGFVRSKFDSCCYMLFSDSIPVYLLLYVDDMLLISKSKPKIDELKRILSSEFDMKDLGKAKKILGMFIERNRDNGSLKIHQSSYLLKTVSKFGVSNAKLVSVPLAGHFILSKSQCPKSESEWLQMENVPYTNAIGTVMYSMISTIPDLAYSISLLSRYMSNPGKEH